MDVLPSFTVIHAIFLKGLENLKNSDLLVNVWTTGSPKYVEEIALNTHRDVRASSVQIVTLRKSNAPQIVSCRVDCAFLFIILAKRAVVLVDYFSSIYGARFSEWLQLTRQLGKCKWMTDVTGIFHVNFMSRVRRLRGTK